MSMLHTDNGMGQVIGQQWALQPGPTHYAPGATNVPLPPGYVDPTVTQDITGDYSTFNCPSGADVLKSREVGMCVGPTYGPIVTGESGGQQYVYDLDGVPHLVEGSAKPKSLIPGVPNSYLYGGLALLALFVLTGRRR